MTRKKTFSQVAHRRLQTLETLKLISDSFLFFEEEKKVEQKHLFKL